MNHTRLNALMDEGALLVTTLLTRPDTSTWPSSYDDWNNRDVAGHVLGWLDYSRDKLKSLKLGTPQSEKYTRVTSLDDINSGLYKQFETTSSETLLQAYRDGLHAYRQSVALYSHEDLASTAFETGFATELWRYLLLDTVIHPTQHILYQGLKRGDYPWVCEVLEASAQAFDAYAPEGEALSLREFALDRAEYQERLTELEGRFGTSRRVRAFVERNRSVGA